MNDRMCAIAASGTVAGREPSPRGLGPSGDHQLSQEYETWRPALIAFYRRESPWMRQKLENLERNEPLSADDKRVIDGLAAAFKVAA